MVWVIARYGIAWYGAFSDVYSVIGHLLSDYRYRGQANESTRAWVRGAEQQQAALDRDTYITAPS